MAVLNYGDAFCAYIDVLGFTSMVRQQHKKLDEYFNIISQFLDAYDHTVPIKILIISDAIILCLKEEDCENSKLEYFRVMLEMVAAMQTLMANIGVWTRGGIARGKLSVDRNKNIIVGEAFIRAFEIEKSANFPRVILDPDLIKSFNHNSIRSFIETINTIPTQALPPTGNEYFDVIFDYKKTGDNINRARDLISDCPMFVDFLSPLTNLGATGEPPLINHLMSDMNGKFEYFMKYRWLAGYCSLKLRVLSENKSNTFFRNAANKLESVF